jgi:flagellar motor switch protein FliM
MSITDLSQILSQEEMAALLTLHRHPSCDPQQDVCAVLNPYDFTSYTQTPFANIEHLETINAFFIHEFDTKIAHLLCQNVECKAGNPEIMDYLEYIHSLDQPSIINLLKINTLPSMAIVTFSASMLSRFINALFGDALTRDLDTNHRVDQVDMRLASLMMKYMCQCLTNAWYLMAPLTFKYVKSLFNPHVVNLTEPHAKVMVNHYTLTMDQIENNFSICIPCNTLELIHRSLSIHQHWKQCSHNHIKE